MRSGEGTVSSLTCASLFTSVRRPALNTLAQSKSFATRLERCDEGRNYAVMCALTYSVILYERVKNEERNSLALRPKVVRPLFDCVVGIHELLRRFSLGSRCVRTFK